MTQAINGSDLMIFKDNKSFALATNCKLNVSVETKETSSKDSGGRWKTHKAFKTSWGLNTENLYASESTDGHTFDDILKLVISGTNEFDAVFTTANESQDIVPGGGWTPKPNTGYKGKVIITAADLNAPNGDNASWTATFEGSGPLEPVSPGK